MVKNTFLYRYSLLSKFLIHKPFTFYKLTKSSFYFICKLSHSYFQTFYIYYFMVCILGLSQQKSSISINISTAKKLIAFIKYNRYNIFWIFSKLIFIYLPLSDLKNLKSTFCKSKNGLIVLRFNFLDFPLFYELDLFYDLGLEVLDIGYLQYGIDIFFQSKFLVASQFKLFIFFFLRFFKFPVFINIK